MERSASETKKAGLVKDNGFQVVGNECIWMRAGIVNFHLCDNNYNCIDCSFDHKMRRAMGSQASPKRRGGESGWAQNMRKKYLGVSKPCIHFLAGRIESPKDCFRDYNCDDCPVDLIQDYSLLSETIKKNRETNIVRGSSSQGEERATKSEHGFYLTDEECIWMKGGVINFRLCDNKYDCYHCAFDQSMREAMKSEYSPKGKGNVMTWEEQIEKYECSVNPCIHSLTGDTNAPMECSLGYACNDCPSHHYYLNRNSVLPSQFEEAKYTKASGYDVIQGYYYHFGHTWVSVMHGGCVKIGVDDFFAKVFGNTPRLELPPIDAILKQGHVGWIMARNGHKAPIQSPLTGRVTAVNHNAMEDPLITHNSPYKEGWLFELEPWFLKRESEALYNYDDCLKWMDHENQDLLKLLGPDYEGLAATGGAPKDDLFAACPEIGWENLIQTFLRTQERR
jgi:glycine cleavage system H lipoate-binding protein